MLKKKKIANNITVMNSMSMKIAAKLIKKNN